jgi:hypothetical protein
MVSVFVEVSYDHVALVPNEPLVSCAHAVCAAVAVSSVASSRMSAVRDVLRK